MPSLLAFWAKLGAHTYPEKYHPVLCHLIDVAVVARQVWDDVFRGPAKERFARAIGLSVEHCRAWVAFWAGAHDIGKVSPGFQQQRRGDPRTVGLVRLLSPEYDFDHPGDTPHATISTPVLRDWLIARGVPATIARRVAVAIGGHHGVFPPPGDLGAATLGNGRWRDARNETLTALANLLGVPVDRPPTAGDGPDQSYLMVLAGLTSAADWVGSNKAFFPEVGTKAVADGRFDFDDYFRRAERQAAEALRALGWTGRATAAESRSFAEIFAYLKLPAVRPLQAAAERHAAEFNGPALVLAEAPMGEGKTEAALCLADAWERRGGQGFYVALPTMATSNGMFGRVERFLDENYPGRKNLHLLHGQSLLSPAYAALQRQAKDHPFVQEVYDESAGADPATGEVVADAWFAQDKKQGLLAPFAVGTIDQALLSVLQTKHGFVRLFGLAGKCVILDEVHAYDAYTSALLKHLLRWLAALGCPVVLLSATLPSGKRRELLEAYAGGPVAPPAVDYPRLTVVRPGAEPPADAEHIPAQPREPIRLEWHDPTALASKLTVALAQGGCAAVIRNTVGLAQQTYRDLKGALPADVGLELFHARFPFARRQEIETGVLQRYGRDRAGKRGMVLVATQVVEQSLDLDFDLLISDVAPVDLVLQRAGRLWRHARWPRPGFDRPAVWLLRPELRDGLPDFGPGEWVYARYVLLRSYLALEAAGTVRLPADVEGLIEFVYTDRSVPGAAGPAWAKALADAEAAFNGEQKENRKAARQFLIAPPGGEDEILDRFNQQLEDESPELPPGRQAFTRLAEPTVALVLLYEVGGRLCLDREGIRPVDLKRRPTLDDAKALLGNAVTVTHKGCVFHYAKVEPPKPWQKNSLLRFHRAVRVGPDGMAIRSQNEYPLTVSDEYGVEFLRPESQDW